ncbi:hypothetical protein [Natronorubrum sp. DTA7]|uniref:hypothetical protein n=1 Tax=Natronorubrum sp. DTA7 TaxID=3447016 RepID=UPI003F853E91
MITELFREPDGWRSGGLLIAVGLFFLGLYAFYGLVGAGGISSALHFGVLWLLLGIPELLPKERTQVAGGLRVLGLVFALALLIFYLSRLSIFQ